MRMILLAVQASHFAGYPIPWPEHVPPEQAWRLAAWLACNVQAGRPALVNANAASGVRIRLGRSSAAGFGGAHRFGLRRHQRFAAEAEAGAPDLEAVCCHYTMGEVGRIGVACAPRPRTTCVS